MIIWDETHLAKEPAPKPGPTGAATRSEHGDATARGVRCCVPLVLLTLSALLAFTSSTATNAPESAWGWNVHCGTSALLIEVSLDGRLVHHVVVPICPAPWPQPRAPSGSQTVSFSFRPTRAIVWHGYRDSEDVAAAGAPLAIELWRASADANSLMLAITASDPVTGAVYMKTVHVAKVDQNSATDIARGLTLSSRPFRLSSR